MTQKEKDELFYSINPIMSYNAFLNFTIGGRGTGKTFGFTKWVLSSPNQCVWVRRYADDLPELMKKFLDAMYKEGLFLEDSFVIKGNVLEMNGEPKIHFIALSVSHKKKSIPYANVDKIIFDEFIETRKNRKYLPEEATTFLDLIETVNRLRIDGLNTLPEVRVFLLGNKVSFVNPYFTFFGIKPFEGRFKKFKDGLIVVENYTNRKFEEMKRKTRFGQLISGTKYEKYAVDNEVWRDSNAFVMNRPKNSTLVCNIRYEGVSFGLWTDNQAVYCCKDTNKVEISFAPRYDMQESEFPFISGREPISWMFNYFNLGKLFFEDNIIKDTVFSIMQENFK